MLAMMGPVRLMCAGTPGTLYATVTAPRLSGIVRRLGFCVCWVVFRGASVPPKSRFLAMIALIPAPLPVPW